MTSDAQWKGKLSASQYYVLREKGTEPAFSGELLHNEQTGQYLCAGCGATLFDSDAKFDSGTGWPSFFRPAGKQAVKEESDDSFGMRRVEVTCAKCGGHLGHVFDDGPAPTGLRYCMNSVALAFRKAKPGGKK